MLIFFLGSFFSCFAETQENSTFVFHYQDLKYTGEVLIPKAPAKGLIIVIPGHGPTEFVGGDQWLELREFLVDQHYSVAYWDKAGNGLSEGEYDHNQSIQSSAEEAVAAIAAIEAQKFPGANNLGFWSISRGGWIVPKISELLPKIKFWISVSGTTELDNSRYMLEANLKAEKRSQEDVELLMAEWDHYQRILVRGGTLEEFSEGTQHLMADPYFNSNDFQMTEEVLHNIQSFFQSGELTFDEATNLAVMYPNLEETLTNMNIPVLAILGSLDTQVDWKATGALYEKAAKKGDMELSPVYLAGCNHVMQQSVTGGIYEELPADAPACDGYYEAMARWIRELHPPKP
ncbi:MAG: alpha/beta hydrolase [Pseudomonadota bacterium]